MNPTKRIIVNTLAQYTRAILNIGLSLYSTRLVLEALNVDDYGIYSLVAGVVGILGYLTNALVVTTQRYLSFYHGAGDIEKVWANPDKANKVLGWKAETSLEDTLKSAWNWQKKLRERGIQ